LVLQEKARWFENSGFPLFSPLRTTTANFYVSLKGVCARIDIGR